MIPDLLPDNHPLLSTVMTQFDFTVARAGEAVALVETLKAAMIQYGGIGLAANQIGIAERAFAMMVVSGPIVLFNPLVTWLSTDTTALEEGCLSFPDMRLKITRPKECQIAYDDELGHRKVLDLKGIEARTALHEIDHLDGITFTRQVSRLRLSMAKKKRSK